MKTFVNDILKAPAERLGLFRIAVGAFSLVYLLVRFAGFVSTATADSSRFEPVGLLAWLGQDEPLSSALALTIYSLCCCFALLFTLGFRFIISGPLFACLLLWVTSYKSSFGMIFHSENLFSLQVIALALAPSARRASIDARLAKFRNPELAIIKGLNPGLVLLLCGLLTIASYFVAGVAKWKLSGMAWVSGDTLRIQVAYDNLRKIELGSFHSPLGAWSVSQAWLFPPLGLLTMLAELGGPLALLHKRLTQIWVFLVVGFHWGVLFLMAIAFAYPLAFVPFLWAFELEKSRLGIWLIHKVEGTASEATQ